jgi:hypothetical protein
MFNPRAIRNQQPTGPGPIDDLDEDQREILEEQTWPLSEAEPELFRAFNREFVRPRLGRLEPVIPIATRKGWSGWTHRTVAHKGKLRFRVERHLDPMRAWSEGVPCGCPDPSDAPAFPSRRPPNEPDQASPCVSTRAGGITRHAV